MRNSLLAALLLVFCSVLSAQQALNNDSVIKLSKAGLSDDLIITTINASPGTYDTSADGLIALKQGGVDDKVIKAILARSSTAPSASTPAAALPPATTQPSANSDSAPSSDSNSPASTDSGEMGTAKGTGSIAAGSRVVIAPMGGFETYFAAAVREKGVPIKLTLDKASAQYFVVSTNTEWEGFVYGSAGAANWNRSGGTAAYGASANSTRGLEASIMLIDARTKDVVWAYEVHKSSHGALLFGTFGARGQQSVAEACAKHLKEFIEKGK